MSSPSQRALSLLMAVLAVGCGIQDRKPAPEEARRDQVIEAPDDEETTPPRPSAPVITPAHVAPPRDPYRPIPAPADVAAPPRDVARTPSGVAMKVLVVGQGQAHPKVEDRVKVHYSAWGKSGVMFDSSVARGQPKIFTVGQVIPGLTEALTRMTVGEKRRLWVPSKMAYGDKPPTGVPAGDLVFEVELLEVFSEPETPRAPEDVSAPPAVATRTPSGLAYRFLARGTGVDHPNEESRVMIHYSGFTPDGAMFDSSIPRKRPSSLALRQMIKGLSEGVQLMAAGDKMRLWIPGDLAYGDGPERADVPRGPLVFDLELVSFH